MEHGARVGAAVPENWRVEGSGLSKAQARVRVTGDRPFPAEEAAMLAEAWRGDVQRHLTEDRQLLGGTP